MKVYAVYWDKVQQRVAAAELASSAAAFQTRVDDGENPHEAADEKYGQWIRRDAATADEATYLIDPTEVMPFSDVVSAPVQHMKEWYLAHESAAILEPRTVAELIAAEPERNFGLQKLMAKPVIKPAP